MKNISAFDVFHILCALQDHVEDKTLDDMIERWREEVVGLIPYNQCGECSLARQLMELIG